MCKTRILPVPTSSLPFENRKSTPRNNEHQLIILHSDLISISVVPRRSFHLPLYFSCNYYSLALAKLFMSADS